MKLNKKGERLLLIEIKSGKTVVEDFFKKLKVSANTWNNWM